LARDLRVVGVTAETGTNRDPRMMLLQYEPGVADPNLGCGVVPSSQAKFKIVASDDNSNGNLQPKLRYTVPTSGCYTVIVYAQQQSDASPMTTSVLRKDIWGPYHIVCNFYSGPTRDLLSSSSQSIPVTGVVIHPPAFDYMFTQNPKNGADPWIFVFNNSTGTGASNDDTGWVNGGSVNSTIDIPGFSYDGSPYSGVLLTGYYTPNVPQNAAWADIPLVEWWAYKRAQ
jgi:hypothetical protein